MQPLLNVKQAGNGRPWLGSRFPLVILHYRGEHGFMEDSWPFLPRVTERDSLNMCPSYSRDTSELSAYKLCGGSAVRC